LDSAEKELLRRWVEVCSPVRVPRSNYARVCHQALTPSQLREMAEAEAREILDRQVW
jgi:hypothetical protein